jgi:hypothetical protein
LHLPSNLSPILFIHSLEKPSYTKEEKTDPLKGKLKKRIEFISLSDLFRSLAVLKPLILYGGEVREAFIVSKWMTRKIETKLDANGRTSGCEGVWNDEFLNSSLSHCFQASMCLFSFSFYILPPILLDYILRSRFIGIFNHFC